MWCCKISDTLIGLSLICICRTSWPLLSNILRSELRKLSEESLTRPPEEVFDVLEKLGEG